MEFKIIEGKTYERLKQSLNELMKRSEKLIPKSVDDVWYTSKDICQRLKISLRTLQNYRDKGLLPYSQIGHKCYYKIKDVESFIEQNKL